MPISSRPGVITFTIEDIKELQAQAKQQGELIHQTIEFGTQTNLPRKLGTGGDCVIQLRGGLTVTIRNAQLQQPLILAQQHDEIFPLVAKFYLMGNSRVKTPQVPEIAPEYEEVAGYNYLYHLPNMSEFEEWQADSFIQVVMVAANLDYFRTLNTIGNTLPPPLHSLMQYSKRFHQSLGKMTPAMTQVLRQIIHCPYQGMIQQLYLESKALELLALQFAYLESDRTTIKQPMLKTDDLERVRYARDILVQRLNNPPSLMELARLVELNERKLKQGFRQLYNTTVFGYLRDYRMEQAQNLLALSLMTVAQVAAKVGYGNPEAFSTAFRRKFGMSPKAYQLGLRG